MAIRYIADTHFGHANVLRYDNRPWQTTEAMEKDMIRLWNEHVAEDDLVYLLGDVVWSDKYEKWVEIFEQLKGRKFIMKGNHDKTKILNALKQNGLIDGWSHQEVVQDPGPDGKARYVVLNHSPMPFFVNMHHDNTYHLYGHVHISFDAQVIKHVCRQVEQLYLHEVRMYNCGCMVPGMDYYPRTLDEIVAIDKANREHEEGHLEEYLHLDVVRGHDKARMA